MYKALARPLLFSMDAENSHRLTIEMMRWIQRSPALLALISYVNDAENDSDRFIYKGVSFRNRVGLAAGFDKQGEVAPFIQALGFGFAEIGTVVPRPQRGNPRPRMFRITEHDTVINRFGFNSDGAEKVAERLQGVRGRVSIPLGISLSKNKETANTPEATAEDCIATLATTISVADYFTICLSSPNTPGLRDLQTAASARIIAREVVAADKNHSENTKRQPKPILVKITCDLDERDALETCSACLEEGVSGFVISNTTKARPFDDPKPRFADEEGGLSGPLLHKRARRMIEVIRTLDDRMLIMGAGGVRNTPSAKSMRNAGADVVQILTGLVFEGPKAVRQARLAH